MMFLNPHGETGEARGGAAAARRVRRSWPQQQQQQQQQPQPQPQP
jgi:hypothetical protein